MTTEIDFAGWSLDLETGVDIVDAQHREYFDLLNVYLKGASNLSAGSEQVLDLAEKLHFLRQYAKDHFSTEESIMLEASYPDSDSHMEEHRHFLRHVDELYLQLKSDGYSPSLGREVNYYIIEWFVEHIRLTDQKLVEHLNRKSVNDNKIPRFLKKLFESVTAK